MAAKAAAPRRRRRGGGHARRRSRGRTLDLSASSCRYVPLHAVPLHAVTCRHMPSHAVPSHAVPLHGGHTAHPRPLFVELLDDLALTLEGVLGDGGGGGSALGPTAPHARRPAAAAAAAGTSSRPEALQLLDRRFALVRGGAERAAQRRELALLILRRSAQKPELDLPSRAVTSRYKP